MGGSDSQSFAGCQNLRDVYYKFMAEDMNLP